MPDVFDEVKKGFEQNLPVEQIRTDLAAKGFLDADIDRGINAFASKDKKKVVNGKKIIFKEFFDRIGFGFSSQQFLNIFLLQTGASYFLIGLVNGFKTILSVLTSSIFKTYTKNSESIKKTVISLGLLTAVIFVLLAFSRLFKSPFYFSLFFLLSGITIVFYGDFYSKLLRRVLKTEHRANFMKKISQYGLLVTGLSLLVAGFLLDRIPGISVGSLRIYGFGIVLGIAALFVILSALILASLKIRAELPDEKRFLHQLSVYAARLKENIPFFAGNRILILLLITSTLVGLVHTLGNSYYSVFIYQNLADVAFGPFMNVAVVFLLAVIASIIGPYISSWNAREYGKFPMLVFGTLLMAITPLTFFYNPNIVSISMGVMIGIIGSSIVSVANGMLTLDLIPEDKRESYFSTLGFFITIPYIITIPIGSYIAQTLGLETLFLLLGLLLVLVVVPIYLVVLLINRKRRI